MPLVQSSENTQHQTPNGLARVQKHIRNVDCSNPTLLSAIAQEQNAKDLLQIFEVTTKFLIFCCQVVSNKVSTRYDNKIEISDSTAAVGHTTNNHDRDGATSAKFAF